MIRISFTTHVHGVCSIFRHLLVSFFCTPPRIFAIDDVHLAPQTRHTPFGIILCTPPHRPTNSSRDPPEQVRRSACWALAGYLFRPQRIQTISPLYPGPHGAPGKKQGWTPTCATSASARLGIPRIRWDNSLMFAEHPLLHPHTHLTVLVYLWVTVCQNVSLSLTANSDILCIQREVFSELNAEGISCKGCHPQRPKWLGLGPSSLIHRTNPSSVLHLGYGRWPLFKEPF